MEAENREGARAGIQVTGVGGLNLGGEDGMDFRYARTQQNILTDILNMESERKSDESKDWGPNSRRLESEITMTLNGFP